MVMEERVFGEFAVELVPIVEIVPGDRVAMYGWDCIADDVTIHEDDRGKTVFTLHFTYPNGKKSTCAVYNRERPVTRLYSPLLRPDLKVIEVEKKMPELFSS